MKTKSMQTTRRWFNGFSASCIWSLAALLSVPAPVLADDTDVFFPSTLTTNQGVIRPNILFVIDTSGSMGGTDGFPQTRLQRVQEAFKQIIDGVNPNVNVGLARFSDTQGGPIMFPVAGVDELVEDVDLSGAGGDRVMSFPIRPNDLTGVNASEAVESHAGGVTVAPSPLQVRSNQNTTNTTVIIPLTRTGADEAEEYSSTSGGSDGAGGPVNGGSAVRCADQLQLISDTTARGGSSSNCYRNASRVLQNTTARTPGTQTVGLRFAGVGIPKDAVIQSAAIQFRQVSGSTGNNEPSSFVRIRGELSTNAAEFQGGPNPSAPSRPSARVATTATVDWASISNSDTILNTADLSPILQEMVSQTGWTAASPAVFTLRTGSSSSFRRTVCGGLFTNNNSSTSVTSDGNCSDPLTVPTLIVNYRINDGTTANSNPKTIGLRFSSVQIPRGVTIKSASVTFRASGMQDAALSQVRIKAENRGSGAGAGDSAEFSNTANNLSSRPVTSGSLLWTLPNGTASGDDFSTPDISSILNEVIKNNSNWCGGNAVTLMFTHETGTGIRSMISRSQDPNLAPILNLSFAPNDPALETGCNKTALSSQVSAIADDSFQYLNNGQNFPACSRLYLGASPDASPASGCGSSSQKKKTTTTALRFQKLNIPQGATVVSAFIDFSSAASTDNTTANFRITAEASSSPATYVSTANHISGRTTTPGKTTASVTWAPGSWSSGTSVANRTTPDLKTVVQEVISRSDWDPNDAIGFFIDQVSSSDTTGTRTALSRDSGASTAPRLRVVIQGSAGKQTVRQKLKEVVDSFTPVGFTPTMGTMYEAARYYRGESAFYGLTRGGGPTMESAEADGSTNNMVINGRAVYDYSIGSPVRNFPPGCSEFNQNTDACRFESWTGNAVYKSPIIDACQSNNIILLSDGEPNNGNVKAGPTGSGFDKSAERLIQDLMQTVTAGASCTGTNNEITGSSGTTRTRCGNEIAAFLKNQDQLPGVGKIPGKQTVTTYTIGFGGDVGSADSPGGQFLRDMAAAGGGEFFTAQSTADVASAFNSIISSILDKGSTFVAPAVTINTFNRLTHRNELYFALFKPSSSPRWEGNLKRYQLFQKVGDSAPLIYDGSPSGVVPGAVLNPTETSGWQPAVDPATGFFKDSAFSFWTSSTADGTDVKAGGAASQLPVDMGLYSYLAGGAPVNQTILTNANRIIETNTAIDSTTDTINIDGVARTVGEAFGVPGPNDVDAVLNTELSNVLKWARGMDVLDEDGDADKTDARRRFGDPLHSEPILISYVADRTKTAAQANCILSNNASGACGGLSLVDHPFITIYMGTNHGYMHAVNADNGSTLFNFIPPELLGNLHAYYENDGLQSSRPYGFDGAFTSYVNDGNSNGYIVNSLTDSTPDTYTVKVGASTVTRNDFAFLYAGMRRGGRNYHAFDVTNRADPKIKFKIVGGAGSFAELGQTWSRAQPINVRVNVGGTPTDFPDDLDKSNAGATQKKKALIFTGGYSPIQDTKVSLYTTSFSSQSIPSGGANGDDMGRALYVINGDDGSLLWSAGPTGTTSATFLRLPDLQFSVPSTPAAIDLDADGFVDRIYFVDVAGQIFRIILGKDASGKPNLSNATGGVIARLSRYEANASNTADTGKHARRFFSTPDLALIKASGSDGFISIAIGSGHRENPLSLDIEDRFYLLRDPDVTNTSPSNLFINGDNDLLDVTDNINGTSIQATLAAGTKKGLYIRLVTNNTLKGEKALTEATTFNNQVIFASFEPASATTSNNTCSASQGLSRFYQINVLDASPVQNFSYTDDGSGGGPDPDAPLTKEDRSKNLNQAGLPPGPVLIFPSISSNTAADGTQTVCTGSSCLSKTPLVFIGAESVSLNSKRKVRKTFWRKTEK